MRNMSRESNNKSLFVTQLSIGLFMPFLIYIFLH